jgi:hypothetical protein
MSVSVERERKRERENWRDGQLARPPNSTMTKKHWDFPFSLFGCFSMIAVLISICSSKYFSLFERKVESR